MHQQCLLGRCTKERERKRRGVNISLFSKQGACDPAHSVIDEWGGNLREI